jgi:hypothetical protein
MTLVSTSNWQLAIGKIKSKGKSKGKSKISPRRRGGAEKDRFGKWVIGIQNLNGDCADDTGEHQQLAIGNWQNQKQRQRQKQKQKQEQNLTTEARRRGERQIW